MPSRPGGPSSRPRRDASGSSWSPRQAQPVAVNSRKNAAGRLRYSGVMRCAGAADLVVERRVPGQVASAANSANTASAASPAARRSRRSGGPRVDRAWRVRCRAQPRPGAAAGSRRGAARRRSSARNRGARPRARITSAPSVVNASCRCQAEPPVAERVHGATAGRFQARAGLGDAGAPARRTGGGSRLPARPTATPAKPVTMPTTESLPAAVNTTPASGIVDEIACVGGVAGQHADQQHRGRQEARWCVAQATLAARPRTAPVAVRRRPRRAPPSAPRRAARSRHRCAALVEQLRH